MSETDEHISRDERQLAIQDRPARTRPRFDPSRDLAAAQRSIDKRRMVQPPREHRRDATTDGPPDSEEEKQRRRKPPPPPPATSTRQAQSGHRSLAFAKPPLRRDSVTESSQVPSERRPLRLRVSSQETPPQRPMPRRVVATPVGGSAPPRLHVTPRRATRGDYYDQSQVRDDRAYGSQYQQERQDWAPHKEEFLQWVIGNRRMHGQDSSTPVNVIKTGVSNHHLLKSVGMIHNRIISNIILNNLLWLSIGLRSNSNNHSNNSCHHYRHLFFHQECNQVYNHLQA